MSISKSSEWINVGFGDSAKIFDGEDFQNPIEGGSSKKLILVKQNKDFALSNVIFSILEENHCLLLEDLVTKHAP